MKKVVCLGMIVMMSFLLGGCKKKEYALDTVIVTINSEYRSKYDEKGFVVEDFQWDNVEKIEYQPELKLPDQEPIMTVVLKKHGKKYVSAAIEHFEKLDFVKIAERSNYYYLH